MPTNRTSALERLRKLPEVFTLDAAAASLGCGPRMALTHVEQWRNRGLVASSCPRVGIHFNLLRNPRAIEERRMEALALLLPGAVVGGPSAVHGAGWTTQIPRRIDIMVPSRPSFPELDGIDIHGRPQPWVETAKNWIALPGPVPWLDPAYALADCVDQGIWTPDPDDIEWDEVDPATLRRAFEHFALDIPEKWKADMELIAQDPHAPDANES